MNRQFTASRPNELWVAGFTFLASWAGFVYVAFVINVLARRIIGWRVAPSMRAEFVLDALEQALYARRCSGRRPSQRPRQPVSIDPLLRALGSSGRPALGG